MSIERDTSRRFRIEDTDIRHIEDVIRRALLEERERPIVLRVERVASEKRAEPVFNVNEQILRLGSEIQTVKNQINKYLKIESREESVNHFRELISRIDEINQVYVENKVDEVIFWIFYDKGDRIDMLEKVVEVECEFERVFGNLNFDYRILPYSAMNTRIASRAELVYKRGT